MKQAGEQDILSESEQLRQKAIEQKEKYEKLQGAYQEANDHLIEPPSFE